MRLNPPAGTSQSQTVSAKVEVCVDVRMALAASTLQPGPTKPATFEALSLNVDLNSCMARVPAKLARRSVQCSGRANTSSPARKCFDVNLRAPHDDRDVVLESLEAADIVKLNDEELRRVASWAGLASREQSELARTMDDVASRFGIDTLCVTLGADGAALRHHGEHRRHPGFKVDVEDTVGAGDAFLAALLDACCENAPLDEWLERGNRLAAHVASCRGATPVSSRELLRPR